MNNAVFAVELLNSLTSFSYASSSERVLPQDVAVGSTDTLIASGWLEDADHSTLWIRGSENGAEIRRNLMLADRLNKLQIQSDQIQDKANKLRRAITNTFSPPPSCVSLKIGGRGEKMIKRILTI